jgi:hypothetical protein
LDPRRALDRISDESLGKGRVIPALHALQSRRETIVQGCCPVGQTQRVAGWD